MIWSKFSFFKRISFDCFNYSTYDIYCNGLVGISKRMCISPPKSFDTFIRQLEQFTGATRSTVKKYKAVA